MTLTAGNNIGGTLYVSIQSGTQGVDNVLREYRLTTVPSQFANSAAADEIVTASEIVAMAKRYGVAYHGLANPNDCHFIAESIAAAIGAPLNPATQNIDNPSLNLEGGYWRIAYRGDAGNPVANWQTLVQAGDIVRMGWTNGGFHTVIVTEAQNNLGQIRAVDNTLKFNTNDVTRVGEHWVDYDGAVTKPNSITIYRLGTDGLYLVRGSDVANDHLFGTMRSDHIEGLASNDIISAAAGNDLIDGGAGTNELYGEAGDDRIVVDWTRFDTVDGGDGIDTLIVNAQTGMEVDLSLASQSYFIFFDGDLITVGSLAVTNVENLTGNTGGDLLSGNDGANTILGRGGNDTIVGRDGYDVLSGGFATEAESFGDDGNDTVSGGDGDDLIIASFGTDTIDGGDGIDTFSIAWTDADATVDLATDLQDGQDVGSTSFFESGQVSGNNVVYGWTSLVAATLYSIDNLVGGAGNNTLFGNYSANVLAGGEGNDVVDGRSGDDVLAGDFLTREETHGRSSDDLVAGGEGDDTIIVGFGNDYADGSNGSDTLSFAIFDTTLTVDLDAYHMVFSEGGAAEWQGLFYGWFKSVDLYYYNFENVIGSAGSDTIFGHYSANVLTGGEGNDAVEGRSGDDVLAGDFLTREETHGRSSDDVVAGGEGDDTIIVGFGNDYADGSNGSDTLSFAIFDTTLTIDLNADHMVFSEGGTVEWQGLFYGWFKSVDLYYYSFENVIGSAGSDTITGTAEANQIYGAKGLDTIIGGDGADTLTGGLVETRAGRGTDGDDLIDGGEGDDLIIASYDNDTIDGGDGSDTLSFAWTGTDLVLVAGTFTASFRDTGNWVDPGGLGGGGWSSLVTTNFQSIENLIGGGGSDVLFGTGDANKLSGGAGVDYLFGYGGDDILAGGNVGAGQVNQLYGGDGIDTADFSQADQPVYVDLRYGVGTIGGRFTDVLFEMENLTGGSHDDTLVGDDTANVLNGAEGADQLYGFGGDDIFIGGPAPGGGMAGSYNVLVGGSGIDTVSYVGTTGDIYADLRGFAGFLNGTELANLLDVFSSIENLIGGAANDLLVGDDTANVLNGAAGSDQLYGFGGDDILLGGISATGAGSYNILVGGTESDTASYAGTIGAVYADLALSAGFVGGTALANLIDLYDSIENLTGGSGDDTLRGDDQANRIEGAAGADILFGLEEADTFVYWAIADSNLTTGVDIIADFVTGIDKIDLRVFGITADNAFIASGGGNTIVYADTDAIEGYDLAVVATGNNAVVISDILF